MVIIIIMIMIIMILITRQIPPPLLLLIIIINKSINGTPNPFSKDQSILGISPFWESVHSGNQSEWERGDRLLKKCQLERMSHKPKFESRPTQFDGRADKQRKRLLEF